MSNIVLSEKIRSISTSPSIAANERVKELTHQGVQVVNFTIGEPDFATPERIGEVAVEAIRQGETHYTASLGTLALREAVVKKLARDNRLQYRSDEVVIGVGGKHLIYSAFAASINPGDEVIVHAPYWVSYPDIAKLHGGVAVQIPGDEGKGFKLDGPTLEKYITPRTKWVVLNSPNNPSGAVYSAAELRSLSAVLLKHPHVLVLSDEIYEAFVYGSAEHLSILNVEPALRDRTMILSGVSKGYAMTGWRIGYAAGPKTLVDGIAKFISQSTTCASSISQAAAVEAFAGDQRAVHDMKAIYARRRNLVLEILPTIANVSCIVPDGAFYIFPNVQGLFGKVTPKGMTLRDENDVVSYLLDEARVATVSGAAYGMGGYIRISYACAEATLIRGLIDMRTAVERLR